MCTAVCYNSDCFYFGRTLDLSRSLGESTVLTPRNFRFTGYCELIPENHLAFIGTAVTESDFPLYFDGVNEKGLCVAGLNFPFNARYFPDIEGKINIPSFMLIPYILSQFSKISEVKPVLRHANITETGLNAKLRPSALHWIIADKTGAVTAEQTEDGLFIYDNPAGVLTNNPPFSFHLDNLSRYAFLSPENKSGRIIKESRHASGFGTGTVGLPGDYTSQGRFIKAAYVKNVTQKHCDEGKSVNAFFHILDSVFVPHGAVKDKKGEYHYTVYSSCCNADKGKYYYTTCDDRRIRCADMNKKNLDTSRLIIYNRHR